MNASAIRSMTFVDFILGTVRMVPMEDRHSLAPTILDALSREFGDHSVRVPGHDDFSLQGGTTNGSLSLGVFQEQRPVAIIYVGCGNGASEAWDSMDGLCHRTFGSPLGQLKLPQDPWAVLVRFAPRGSMRMDWLVDFAKDVGWAWVGR